MRDEVSAITHLRAVPDKLPLIRPRAEPQAPSPKWGKAFHHTKEGYTGGVGYFVQIPATTGEALPPAGQEGTVYTIMNVTENDVSLYGFAAEEQRDCFKMLTGVTGVGPKAALSILSIMTPERIALAASSGDHKAFTKAAGVGPKLAQRITLELKDKVGKGLAAGTGFSGNVAAPAPSSAPAQAVAALVSLGYAPSDAAAAVARVDETLSVQEIITIALRSLSRV